MCQRKGQPTPVKVFVIHETGEYPEDGNYFCGVFSTLDGVAGYLAHRLAEDLEFLEERYLDVEHDPYWFTVKEVTLGA